MNDIFSYRKNAREIKDEKTVRESHGKRRVASNADRIEDLAENRQRGDACGTINRYGQLLESTSRVQFAAPHQRVDASCRGEEKGQSPREAEG